MTLLLLKSLFISIISTTGINMIYKTENIGINSVVIILTTIIAFFIMKKDEEEKMNKLFEERKYQLELKKEENKKANEYIQSYISEIKEFNSNIANLVEKNNDRLIASIEQQITNLYNVIKAQEEKINNINKTMNSIENINSNSNYINKLLGEQCKVIDNFKKIFEETMKLNYKQKDELKSLINDYSINSSKNTLEIKKLIEININKELNDICEIARKQEEKIDCINDKANILEEMNINIDSINKGLEEHSRIINKFKKTFEETMDEEQEQKQELLDGYKKIYNESLKQIIELTSKNEYIVQLLMDNYKVLNAVIDN